LKGVEGQLEHEEEEWLKNHPPDPLQELLGQGLED
jgi:hypothetical protein